MMFEYIRKFWKNSPETEILAEDLNNIEEGIFNAHQEIKSLTEESNKVKTVIGYEKSGVDISSYSSFDNTYEVPSDGIVQITVSSSTQEIFNVRLHAKTYVNDSVYSIFALGEVCSTSGSDWARGDCNSFPVYKGQRIFLLDPLKNCLGTEYATALFIPYIYSE